MKKTGLLLLLVVFWFPPVTYAYMGEPMFHDRRDAKRMLAWTDPYLEGGWIDYDYYTQTGVLRKRTDDVTVITFKAPFRGFTEYFQTRTGLKLRGFCIEEGIREVICSDNAAMLETNLDFVYIPSTFIKGETFLETQVMGFRVKWLFCAARGTVTISGRTDFPERDRVIENAVFNCLDIKPIPGHLETEIFKRIKNLYITDRAKTVLSYRPGVLEAVEKVYNLQEIPYEQLFEDIKNKPVSEFHPHLAHIPNGYTRSYSEDLGFTVKNTYNIFRTNYYSVCFEFDPYSHTAYIQGIINRQDFDDFEATSTAMHKLFDVNNVVFVDGTEEFIYSKGFMSYQSVGYNLVYTPPTMIKSQMFEHDEEIPLLILGNGDMAEGVYADGPTYYKDVVILDDIYTKKLLTKPDSKIYAKSNLIHPDVRYTLDAFPYYPIIVAFNSVGNVDVSKINFAHTDLTFDYTIHANTGDLSGFKTLKTALHVGSYDVSYTPAIVSVPQGLTASFNHNVLTLTQTGRITPGKVAVDIKFGQSTVRREITVTPQESYTGTVTDVAIHLNSGDFPDITNQRVYSTDNSPIPVKAVWQPAQLRPESIGWEVTENNGTHVGGGGSETVNVFYNSMTEGRKVFLTVDGLRATTTLGPYRINDTIHQDITVWDTINQVYYQPVYRDTLVYDTTHTDYIVWDTLHADYIKWDTIRTTVYDTVRATRYEYEYEVILRQVEIPTTIQPLPRETSEPYIYKVSDYLFEIFSPYRDEELLFYSVTGILLDRVSRNNRDYIQPNVLLRGTVITVSTRGWYQKLIL